MEKNTKEVTTLSMQGNEPCLMCKHREREHTDFIAFLEGREKRGKSSCGHGWGYQAKQKVPTQEACACEGFVHE